MRPTLTALLLCGALSSSAQWTYPASPDTIAMKMIKAGDHLVAAGQMQKGGYIAMLAGGALIGVQAALNSERPLEKSNALFYGGAALITFGVGINIGASHHITRAGRYLRRKT